MHSTYSSITWATRLWAKRRLTPKNTGPSTPTKKKLGLWAEKSFLAPQVRNVVRPRTTNNRRTTTTTNSYRATHASPIPILTSMASTMNVCRTTLLRRALATSAPARSSSTIAATSSRTAFAYVSSSPSSSCTRSPASSSFFSTSSASRNAAAPADAPSQDAAATPAAEGDAAPAALSSCPEGTVLVGLNYTKGKTDPVALRDEEYPSWLWNCLEVMKKAATEEDADAGDEFCRVPPPPCTIDSSTY